MTLIDDGRVRVGGRIAVKAATGVTPDEPVVVRPAPDGRPDYVSRGAHKLVGALDAFRVDPIGARCIDAGASTGGFTDVLLRRGAAGVVAVDVGYGLLAWRLRTDERVTVVDRTNVRLMSPAAVGGRADLVVADLSFISLRLVLPVLLACTRFRGDLLPMVKPQFEVGRDQVGSGGVVRDPARHRDAVRAVASTAIGLGARVEGVVASPLPGPAGNVEYFLHLRPGAPADADGPSGRLDALIAAAVEAGPHRDARADR